MASSDVPAPAWPITTKPSEAEPEARSRLARRSAATRGRNLRVVLDERRELIRQRAQRVWLCAEVRVDGTGRGRDDVLEVRHGGNLRRGRVPVRVLRERLSACDEPAQAGEPGSRQRDGYVVRPAPLAHEDA